MLPASLRWVGQRQLRPVLPPLPRRTLHTNHCRHHHRCCDYTRTRTVNHNSCCNYHRHHNSSSNAEAQIVDCCSRIFRLRGRRQQLWAVRAGGLLSASLRRVGPGELRSLLRPVSRRRAHDADTDHHHHHRRCFCSNNDDHHGYRAESCVYESLSCRRRCVFVRQRGGQLRSVRGELLLPG